MRRGLSTAALAFLLILPRAGATEETAVLVTGSACPISEISSLDVRKAYLGVTLRIDGHSIRPLRLNHDERLNGVFFQSVVAMSRKSYERRLLSLVLKFGTPRPVEYDNPEDAFGALRRIHCSVVYVWEHELRGITNIKVLRVLWRG